MQYIIKNVYFLIMGGFMPVTEFDKRVVDIAITEWWAFGSQYVNGDTVKSGGSNIKSLSSGTKNSAKESNSGFKERTWTYFKFGVFPHSNGWQGYKTSAWSAAFMSYCMRLGGAQQNFPYGVSHSTYVNQAVRNQLAGLSSNVMTAHSKELVAPSPGDLLWKMGYNRYSDWTHEELVSHVKGGGKGYNSHCDLVVDVDREAQVVYVIGGNVSDRVLRLKLKIDDEGLINSKRYATVLKNNISEFVGS